MRGERLETARGAKRSSAGAGLQPSIIFEAAASHGAKERTKTAKRA
jgi:hypothetical protein